MGLGSKIEARQRECPLQMAVMLIFLVVILEAEEGGREDDTTLGFQPY